MSGASPAPTSKEQAITIRRASPSDAEACGRVCFEAFRTLATHHNFLPDFPAPEPAIGALSAMFSHPGFFCIVAEQDGKVIGSNCLDERSVIAGLGPITIDPNAQNRSVGRQLMEAAMTRARERKFVGVRLVQAGYHTRSLSLYAKLGFVVREPLACMPGPAINKAVSGYCVRTMQPADLATCNALCVQVHGHDRGGDLKDAIQQGSAVVAEAEGRIRAYASSLAFYGHCVAETNEGVQALIAGAAAFVGPGILVPLRNGELFRWCLENGLRVTQTLTLMTMGLYNEPVGAYLPSILF